MRHAIDDALRAPTSARPYRTPEIRPAAVEAEPLESSALVEELVVGVLLVVPVIAGLASHHFGAVETSFSLTAVFVWKHVLLGLLAARRGPFATSVSRRGPKVPPSC
jgi:hypothetical protein